MVVGGYEIGWKWKWDKDQIGKFNWGFELSTVTQGVP